MSCSSCNKNVFNKATNIAKGITNVVIKDPAIEHLAKTRLEVCAGCKFLTELVKVGNKSVFQCNLCKCLVELKTRVKEENCPDNKW